MTGPDQLPSPHPGLQPERTALAWRRLSLVLLGLSLASTRLLWPRLDAWTLAPTLLVAGAAVLVLWMSQRRYLAQLHRAATRAPDGRLPLAAAAAALAISLLWLLVVVTAG